MRSTPFRALPVSPAIIHGTTDIRGLLAKRILALLPSHRHRTGLILDHAILATENRPRALAQMDAIIWMLSHTHEDWEHMAEAIQGSKIQKILILIDDLNTPQEASDFSLRTMLEETLGNSGQSIHLLRYGFLMENLVEQWDLILEEGYFSHPQPGDDPLSMISAADLARVTIALLENQTDTGIETLSLQGDHLSLHAAAGHLARALERLVTYEESSNFALPSANDQAPSRESRHIPTPTSFPAWLLRD